jgi:hypothetical protein
MKDHPLVQIVMIIQKIFIRNIPELLYLEPVEQHLNLQLNLLAPLRQVYRQIYEINETSSSN